MKDETLLDRATANYRIALKNYHYRIGDECELNIVGYLLQQSLELAIKHFLEMGGIRYSHTHSIEDLLDECEANDIEIVYSDELYSFAPAISKWESKTRYIKNYFLAKRQVDIGMRLIKEFFVVNGVKVERLEIPEMKSS